jgi:hypothetical protein
VDGSELTREHRQKSNVLGGGDESRYCVASGLCYQGCQSGLASTRGNERVNSTDLELALPDMLGRPYYGTDVESRGCGQLQVSS